MADKTFRFNFAARGLSAIVSGITKVRSGVVNLAKEIKKANGDFKTTYDIHKKEGISTFSSFIKTIRTIITQSKVLAAVLKMIRGITGAGILAFLASKAFQNNLAGIATVFARISGAFGELWGKFNIAINEFMRAMGPVLGKTFKDLGAIIVGVLKGITWLLDQFIKAPNVIKVLVGSLAVLGVAFWTLSVNPFFVTIGAIVGAVWLLYRGVRAIVDLFRGNSRLTMDASITYGAGQRISLAGAAAPNMTNNSVNNIQNNVYLHGTGSGVGDAKAISNELSFLNSISRVG